MNWIHMDWVMNPVTKLRGSATFDKLLDWLKNLQVTRGALVLGQIYVKHFSFEELPAPITPVIEYIMNISLSKKQKAFSTASVIFIDAPCIL